jgi:hypothetical protein
MYHECINLLEHVEKLIAGLGLFSVSDACTIFMYKLMDFYVVECGVHHQISHQIQRRCSNLTPIPIWLRVLLLKVIANSASSLASLCWRHFAWILNIPISTHASSLFGLHFPSRKYLFADQNSQHLVVRGQKLSVISSRLSGKDSKLNQTCSRN